MGDFTSESQESLEEIMDEEYRLKGMVIDYLERRKRQDDMKSFLRGSSTGDKLPSDGWKEETGVKR